MSQVPAPPPTSDLAHAAAGSLILPVPTSFPGSGLPAVTRPDDLLRAFWITLNPECRQATRALASPKSPCTPDTCACSSFTTAPWARGLLSTPTCLQPDWNSVWLHNTPWPPQLPSTPAAAAGSNHSDLWPWALRGAHRGPLLVEGGCHHVGPLHLLILQSSLQDEPPSPLMSVGLACQGCPGLLPAPLVGLCGQEPAKGTLGPGWEVGEESGKMNISLQVQDPQAARCCNQGPRRLVTATTKSGQGHSQGRGSLKARAGLGHTAHLWLQAQVLAGNTWGLKGSGHMVGRDSPHRAGSCTPSVLVLVPPGHPQERQEQGLSRQEPVSKGCAQGPSAQGPSAQGALYICRGDGG
uniref:uncharacterized protein LOC118146739 n=1 Tax=Callithrix jacchus TaxID=9483 RepID=UPI0023DD17C5|nr:uncharacterized protein LOC118146739 [Callithrix jacchus]